MRYLRAAMLALISGFIALPAAAADEYPNRALRIVVLAPAGTTDTLARAYAAELSQRLGQPVLVDNRPGGAGNIGMDFVAKSPPDGYTVVVAYQGVLAVNPVLMRNLSWQPADLAPVAYIGHVPMALIVASGSPMSSLQDFVAVAKRSGREMNYGTAGNSTTSHLAMELFKQRVEAALEHVPYKGESPAITDLMGGRLSGMFSSLPVALPLIRAGKLRALGVASNSRSSLAPEIPALGELGFKDFEVSAWFGIMAPVRTPAPAVDRLSREFSAIGREPEFRARMTKIGVETSTMSKEVFGPWLLAEMDRWKGIVTKAAIKAD